jgi:hypothetical protein
VRYVTSRSISFPGGKVLISVPPAVQASLRRLTAPVRSFGMDPWASLRTLGLQRGPELLPRPWPLVRDSALLAEARPQRQSINSGSKTEWITSQAVVAPCLSCSRKGICLASPPCDRAVARDHDAGPARFVDGPKGAGDQLELGLHCDVCPVDSSPFLRTSSPVLEFEHLAGGLQHGVGIQAH